MKIIIVGAGRVGFNLAHSLSEEDNEVYLIEKNEEIVRRADEKLDAKVICGSGADPDILEKAQVSDADLVIAVTMSDEVNLIVCSLAEFFGSKRQIARVRNKSLSEKIEQEGGHEHFNIDEMINPEEVAAQAIVKIIEAPGAREVGDFADGKILLRSFNIPENSPLCGLKIVEFNHEDFPWPFLIVAISRDKTVVIPKGDTVVKQGDRIYVLLLERSLAEFLVFVDPENKKSNKVVIFGATDTGEYLAKALIPKVKDIILLEEAPFKAQVIANALQEVRVINGSAAERDILTESGIEVADVFIAASKNDHSNLISAVLAKKMGAKTTIILTQQPDYASIGDALAIDVIINPHILAAEQILKYVRGKGINSVTKILECDAEVLEFVAEEGSPITKAQLKELNFPKHSIVGAVCRGEESELAKGETQIKAGDKAIVFCQEKDTKKLQKVFTLKSLSEGHLFNFLS